MPAPLIPLLAVTPQAVALSAAGATLVYHGVKLGYTAFTSLVESREEKRRHEAYKNKVYAKIEGNPREGHRVVFNWFGFSTSMAAREFRACSLSDVCDKMVLKLTREASSRDEKGPKESEVLKAIVEANRLLDLVV